MLFHGMFAGTAPSLKTFSNCKLLMTSPWLVASKTSGSVLRPIVEGSHCFQISGEVLEKHPSWRLQVLPLSPRGAAPRSRLVPVQLERASQRGWEIFGVFLAIVPCKATKIVSHGP